MKHSTTAASVKNAGSRSATSKSNSKTGQRLYLAGPIRGIPDFEQRFAHATILLRHAGFYVFNPVEQDEAFIRHGTPVDIRHCLELDLVWICRWADVVGLLPGWQNSSGAMAEFYTAKALGTETWELPPEYCLD